jgi:hypothetical protein
MYFRRGAFSGVTTWMSGGLTPTRREKAAKPGARISDDGGRPRRLRPAYILAVVWVLVGSALYAVEVVRLVSGLG